MKKYYPLDFDEKGKVILGNAKNTPTPMRGTPAIYVESGSDEGKNGLKSITISPSITTNPALDTVFPIYWDDLTDEEKENGVEITLNVDLWSLGSYSATVTPTSNWYAATYNGGVPSIETSQGESATYSAFEIQGGEETVRFHATVTNTDNPGPDTEFVAVTVILNNNGQ